MATREFYTNGVVSACRAEVANLEAAMAARHEERIVELMNQPCGGFWPFTKPRLRSRSECEEHYGLRSKHVYSSYWWTERAFRGRIAGINSIKALADAMGADSLIRLSDEEANLIGAA